MMPVMPSATVRPGTIQMAAAQAIAVTNQRMANDMVASFLVGFALPEAG